MKNLKSYLIVTFIAGNLPSAICLTEQPPDQAAHSGQSSDDNPQPLQQMTPDSQTPNDPANARRDRIAGVAEFPAYWPQMFPQGQQGFFPGYPHAQGGPGAVPNVGAFPNGPFPQGFPQNPHAQGGPGAVPNVSAIPYGPFQGFPQNPHAQGGPGAVPNAGAFPNGPSHQGMPQYPNPYGVQGVNSPQNAGAFSNMPPPQGFPPNPGVHGDPGAVFNAATPPNMPPPQGSPQNLQGGPAAYYRLNTDVSLAQTPAIGFGPNPSMQFNGPLQRGPLPYFGNISPHFTIVLGKLDEACQTNYRIGAARLAALPPSQRAGERTQATIQAIQTFITDHGLPDSAVIILEAADGRLFRNPSFSQLQLIDSWTNGSKEIIFDTTFSRKNIVNFLNGRTGTAKWPAAFYQQLWRAGTLQFFVIYNDEIYVVFPTNEQNPSLFATNTPAGSLPEIKMDAVAKGARAVKAGAAIYDQQRSLSSRAMDKLKFWKTSTPQQISNWADIASAFAGAVQQ
jgi:hypothetical protein